MNSSLRSARVASKKLQVATAVRASDVRASSTLNGSRCSDHRQRPAFRSAALGRNQRAFSLSPNTAPIEPHQQSMNYYPLKDEAVPRSLQDALRMTSRAVVITETTMPFPVFNVNKAWENLCGYTYRESKGKSLGDLLKGPETDPLAVTALLSQLLRGEDATTILTNYKKSGEKFQNRLRVGPLYNEDGKITHFVGILQQV